MSERKKIAAIITTYFPLSHADVIATKYMKGFPTDEGLRQPRVDLVSIYLDQIDPRDIGRELAGITRRPDLSKYPSGADTWRE